MPVRFEAALLAVVLTVGAWGQTASTGSSTPVPPNQTKTQRQTSTPYSGDLSIFEYPDRDKKLQIDRVMDLLGITSGKNVADIGAGSGWFTVRAARRVGLTGAVLAEDINPLAIEYIGKRVVKEDIRNVRTVLGSADDPRLPAGSIDAALMLKVYHEIAHPELFLKALKPALRSGAKVGIIDRNGNGADHGLDHKAVVKEMDDAGFKLVGSYDFTKADKEDYFLIFQTK
ncbi:MAG TPA: methyltransferase domain-containing protein [Edaphobacter sp.]|jgi:ubiquinone/menaquinone biosynthesis C-methylase UbiE|nr:methyltransferase domain-containing protein [Edaphobacter sp.]